MSKIPELPSDIEKRARGKLAGRRSEGFVEIIEPCPHDRELVDLRKLLEKEGKPKKLKREKEKYESFWQFALVNGRLAEVFFEKGRICGYCYVEASEYKTKQEKQQIKSDTEKLQLTFRKGIYKDKLTGKIISRKNFPTSHK